MTIDRNEAESRRAAGIQHGSKLRQYAPSTLRCVDLSAKTTSLPGPG